MPPNTLITSSLIPTVFNVVLIIWFWSFSYFYSCNTCDVSSYFGTFTFILVPKYDKFISKAWFDIICAYACKIVFTGENILLFFSLIIQLSNNQFKTLSMICNNPHLLQMLTHMGIKVFLPPTHGVSWLVPTLLKVC